MRPGEAPPYKSVTPEKLKAKLDGGSGDDPGAPLLLDVREPWEYDLARIEGSKLLPMSEVPERLGELDPKAETVVVCHHGTRSAAVTRFLDASGFGHAFNLEGGIDAYAAVDPAVGRY